MRWQLHELFLNRDLPLSGKQIADFSEMVARRRRRIPLQHLTGSVEFMGREFISGPNALVPRPETEVLVETVVDRLEYGPRLIIDVGTGSGVISITLALEYPQATVLGMDISGDALGLAARNRECHSARNVLLVSADLMSATAFALPGGGACALVANLPYIPSGDLSGLQPEVRLGDPRVALDGGADGMRVLSTLLGNAADFVRPGGLVAVEVGAGQAETAVSLLADSGCWCDIRSAEDLAGIERVVSALRTGSVRQ
jgi:release factor glutamine methyltransferase